MNEKNQNDILDELNTCDLSNYPITTNAFSWTPIAIILYSLLHILSLLLPLVFILTFFDFVMMRNLYNWIFIRLFIDVLAWWGMYILSSLLFGKLFLIILKLLHKPKEGIFRIDNNNRDYQFYCLRIAVKKFVFWIWNNFCFPWVSNLAFKLCDMRADFKSTMFDGWSDVEFIDFGKSIMLGQGAVVLSSMVLNNYLLIKKVIIGDHVVIGGNAIVAPGTVIGSETTLGVWACTHINQALEPGWIYIGRPARKFQPSEKMIEESKSQAVRRIVDTGKRVPYDVNKFTRLIRRKKKK
ncbi:MAG: hypothetical protein GF383_04715 [Candidatus Lokiarchaeota archaeon]|nr:hypothetical protein [Candidatus Lokiarchaeota archaeon]MBD3339098.1 hypothetical protein [Candidatus Lokiarchaeota archaeon]